MAYFIFIVNFESLVDEFASTLSERIGGRSTRLETAAYVLTTYAILEVAQNKCVQHWSWFYILGFDWTKTESNYEGSELKELRRKLTNC